MMIEEIPIIENSSDQNFSRTLSLTSYTFTTIILSISIILATPSNMMIIWLVFKTPFLRNKAVNMLIVNLCFLDLIASCLDMPLKWIIVHMNHHNDQYHKFICKCQLFAHTMSISGQLLSFVSVGYERYHTVSNPFDKEKVRRITHFLISICWILAIALSLLQLFFAPETIDFALCEHLSNGNNNNGIIYIMWPFGIFCFLLVAFFYGRIVWLVRKHCKNVNTIYRKMPTTLSGTNLGAMGGGTSTVTNQTVFLEIPNDSITPSIYGDVCVLDTKNRSLGRRKIEAETAKRSIFVLVSFILFTVPYPLTVLIDIHTKFSIEYATFFEIQYCLNLMTILSAAFNPIVYGLANKQFRMAFQKIYYRYLRQYKSREFI
ncbi:nitric oxide synthase 1 [Sarcoptes scabiei]|nr:nitric oxide synthase 1 [Sarcoptes scabiei]